ncbi:MAG TPA: RsmD family RNA methyltransferase [Acidimicrobiales bacterium]
MRVIGGSSRGRKLPARLPAGVRPTSDRVRESIFDILGSMGGVEGASVVDLFCGSGALGAEALSRGAADVTFVDHDTAALEAVRANLAATGLAARSVTVVRAELPGWLSRCPPVDVALCDPPYAFGDWTTLLGSLRAAVAVLESAREVDVPAGWAVHRARRYGGTLVTVARMTPAAPPAATPARTVAPATVS